MGSRFFALGAVAVLTVATASSAVAPLRIGLRAASAPGRAHLHAVGSRSGLKNPSAANAKLDSVLADLSRHAALARPAHVLADLHSLSPAARFTRTKAGGAALVLVDATTRGDPQQLKSALMALGLERAAVYSNDVGGWLPVAQLETAAARGEVAAIRAAMPRRRIGAVTSQGDYAQRSSPVRANYPDYPLTGSGVTVGILSDSFNCYAVYAAPGSGVPVSGGEGYAPNGFTADYATDISTGDLPANVDVLEEADEGDCMGYIDARGPDAPPNPRLPTKAGRCCKSFMISRPARVSRFTRPIPARPILPPASAGWPPPAQK